MTSYLPIDTAESYRAARKAFTVDSTLYDLYKVADEEGGIRSDSSVFAKFLTGLATPPYRIKYFERNGRKYALLGNRPENDRNWNKEEHKATASMSGRYHKFLVPVIFSDWRLCNVLSLPKAPEVVAILEDMIAIGEEISIDEGIEPEFYFHCAPNSTVPLLHMHIVAYESLGPAFYYQEENHKNLRAETVLQVIRE